jgi:hypothetical protein
MGDFMRFFYSDDPWLYIDDPGLATNDASGDHHPIDASVVSDLGDAAGHDAFSPAIDASSRPSAVRGSNNER